MAGSWPRRAVRRVRDPAGPGRRHIQLIVFRALQGLGGGALFTTAAIIADLYAPLERAKFSGLFSAVFGISSVFGPVIGGFFTDHGTVTLFGHLIQAGAASSM